MDGVRDRGDGGVRDIVLGSARDLHPGWRPDVLGGCVMISGTAELAPPNAGWDEALYREMGSGGAAPARETVTMQAISYHLWGNRGQGSMTVLLRRE